DKDEQRAPRRERKSQANNRRNKPAQAKRSQASQSSNDEDTGFSFADLLGDQLKDLNLDDSSED
ncbi:30S ribosomal protein S1, partial [Aerococcus urinae]|nr:30S ribosomal protein S1 [Aerococcus urinae]